MSASPLGHLAGIYLKVFGSSLTLTPPALLFPIFLMSVSGIPKWPLKILLEDKNRISCLNRELLTTYKVVSLKRGIKLLTERVERGLEIMVETATAESSYLALMAEIIMISI